MNTYSNENTKENPEKYNILHMLDKHGKNIKLSKDIASLYNTYIKNPLNKEKYSTHATKTIPDNYHFASQGGVYNKTEFFGPDEQMFRVFCNTIIKNINIEGLKECKRLIDKSTQFTNNQKSLFYTNFLLRYAELKNPEQAEKIERIKNPHTHEKEHTQQNEVYNKLKNKIEEDLYRFQYGRFGWRNFFLTNLIFGAKNLTQDFTNKKMKEIDNTNSKTNKKNQISQ